MTRICCSIFHESIEQNAACSQVLYHYTDLPSAKAIVGGRQGLRLSRGGYKGGGVFFSTRAPVEELNPAESNRWQTGCGVGWFQGGGIGGMGFLGKSEATSLHLSLYRYFRQSR